MRSFNDFKIQNLNVLNKIIYRGFILFKECVIVEKIQKYFPI